MIQAQQRILGQDQSSQSGQPGPPAGEGVRGRDGAGAWDWRRARQGEDDDDEDSGAAAGAGSRRGGAEARSARVVAAWPWHRRRPSSQPASQPSGPNPHAPLAHHPNPNPDPTPPEEEEVDYVDDATGRTARARRSAALFLTCKVKLGQGGEHKTCPVRRPRWGARGQWLARFLQGLWLCRAKALATTLLSHLPPAPLNRPPPPPPAPPPAAGAGQPRGLGAGPRVPHLRGTPPAARRGAAL
jgi:hypothetical protein